MRARPRFWLILVSAMTLHSATSPAQPPDSGRPAEESLVRARSSVIAREHVRILDGTGAKPKADQTILVREGKIAAIGDAASVKVPASAKRIDLSERTALPGLVGMHDHLFYVTTTVNANFVAHDMPLSFPRLYLANGVTTIRSAGSYEPYTDLEIKRAVDAGTMIGPKINVTGPYLATELHALCLGQTDILVLCARLNQATSGLVDGKVLNNLPQGAYLVNAARGALIDYRALYSVLRRGHLAGAGWMCFGRSQFEGMIHCWPYRM
jgi:hypothetical protein